MLALVIPATRELDTIPTCLRSLKTATGRVDRPEDIQVIVVVNQPIGSSSEVTDEGRRTIEMLSSIGSALPFTLHTIGRIEPGLSHGVGEARRIGMDFAVNNLLVDPSDLIISLDADATVERNYFEVLLKKRLLGAAFTLRFEHDLTKAQNPEATAVYELYLRYMRQMLLKAGSPFAFFTIGSCLGTDVAHYISGGGMPARPATEDFHFLNNLRKQGVVEHWAETCVYPSARTSDRVFLGTGYFIAKAQDKLENAFYDLMLPSPRAFDLLARILRNLENSFDTPEISLTNLSGDPSASRFLDIHKVVLKLNRLKENSRDRSSFEGKLIQLFDGLMTYRLLRDLSEAHPKPSLGEFLNWTQEAYSAETEKSIELLDVARNADRARVR